MIIFRDGWILSFLFLLPFIPIAYANKKRISAFSFSSMKMVEGIKPSYRMRMRWLPALLRIVAIALTIFALARPQKVLDFTKTISEGVDIALTIDTSTSMLAEDFKVGSKRVNRYDVVREVVKDFINKRKGDRIGMVAFAARAYTVCPLTTDYQWLLENLNRVRVGMIEDGTAVGSAIATSLNRLKNSKTKSKIIILLTDGINNAGNISPIVAAEAAKAFKIKVYTIGVGSKGLVPYPLKDNYGRIVYQNIPIEMDEESLKQIAAATGAKYYHATDTETLIKIYDDINRLEKSNIEHTGYREYNELFFYFLIPAIIIFMIELLLSYTVFLKIP